ncbi:MAG: hypothetical protein ACPGJE_07280 [Wenzhouxiangellaceae bacterium]
MTTANRKQSSIYARLVSRLAVLALVSSLMLPAANAGLVKAPDGFDDLLVYLQNGIFDPAAPHPVIPGCAGGICDGNYFQEVFQGRTTAEVEALEAQAKSFFFERFGIDVDDPAMAGRAVLQRFLLDPRAEYRAYVISDVYVPPEGFVINDGGWLLIITDPNGIELTSGPFAGQRIPAASLALFGEYQIEVQRGARVVRTIDLSYRSGSFVIPDANGLAHFGCELKRGRLDENGFFDLSVPRDGLAQGYAAPFLDLGDGTVKANVRNTITIGGLGGI